MQQNNNYRQVPNFNLIPPEYRKPTISVRRLLPQILLGLIIIVEITLLPGIFSEASSLKSAAASSRTRLQQIQAQLTAANARKQEADQLTVTMNTLNQQLATLQADAKAIKANQPDWSKVMAAFFQKSGGIRIQSLVRDDATHVTATGSAVDYSALLDYRHQLLDSPAISKVSHLESNMDEAGISFSLQVEVKIRGQ